MLEKIQAGRTDLIPELLAQGVAAMKDLLIRLLSFFPA